MIGAGRSCSGPCIAAENKGWVRVYPSEGLSGQGKRYYFDGVAWRGIM
jgi:hypothetical protein